MLNLNNVKCIKSGGTVISMESLSTSISSLSTQLSDKLSLPSSDLPSENSVVVVASDGTTSYVALSSLGGSSNTIRTEIY